MSRVPWADVDDMGLALCSFNLPPYPYLKYLTVLTCHLLYCTLLTLR